MTTSNTSAMHNDIMAASSKEPYSCDNTTTKVRALIDAEAEAVHMILNGIGESINTQDVKTKLFWEFGKFTSRDGESVESYYTRFYKMMNEMVRNKLKVDTMQQYQNEVNEILAERISRDENPIALVAATQHYPDYYPLAPKTYPTQTPSPRQTTSIRSHATPKQRQELSIILPHLSLIIGRRRSLEDRKIQKGNDIHLKALQMETTTNYASTH
ncbi:hypothetical protein Tco_0019285 [Tanacetum coccineum]